MGEGRLLLLDRELLLDVRVCDSKGHARRLATKLLHWVTGPVEYCESCCVRMLQVAQVLGVHYCHVEEIPVPPELLADQRRGIDLTGRMGDADK